MVARDGIDVSVVVPCRNGQGTISAQLDALLTQETGARFEVIISDNGSVDDTASIVSEYCSQDRRVRYVWAGEMPGGNHARNKGVVNSRGWFILHCDCDDVVAPGWIEAYWRLAKAGANLVGGALVHVSAAGRVLWRSEPPFGGAHTLPCPVGANCGYAKQVFDEVGGFDERFVAGGDEGTFFWSAQLAGYKMTWEPRAEISYTERLRLSDTVRQTFGYGVGEVKLFRQFRDRVFGRRLPGRSFAGLLGGLLQLIVVSVLLRDGRAEKIQACKRIGGNLGRLVGAVRLRVPRYL